MKSDSNYDDKMSNEMEMERRILDHFGGRNFSKVELVALFSDFSYVETFKALSVLVKQGRVFETLPGNGQRAILRLNTDKLRTIAVDDSVETVAHTLRTLRSAIKEIRYQLSEMSHIIDLLGQDDVKGSPVEGNALLSITESVQYTGVPQRTLYRYIREGVLPHSIVSDRIMVRQADLAGLMRVKSHDPNAGGRHISDL